VLSAHGDPDHGAGTHRIIVQDASGAVLGWTQITVTETAAAAPGAAGRGLAATGIDVAPWLAGGVLLLVIGAVLLGRNRISRKS
jgi:hypothetical protein